ncbi:unnamed protein product [Alopecurus aequalis]
MTIESPVDKMIDTEKMRKALVVVVEALEIKNKGSELVEIDKSSVEALLDALPVLVEETGKDAVTVDGNLTETFSVEKLLEGAEWRDDELFEGEVDEEELKLFAEMQEEITRMWDNCIKRLIEGGVEFGDPSVPQCLVA